MDGCQVAIPTMSFHVFVIYFITFVGPFDCSCGIVRQSERTFYFFYSLFSAFISGKSIIPHYRVNTNIFSCLWFFFFFIHLCNSSAIYFSIWHEVRICFEKGS